MSPWTPPRSYDFDALRPPCGTGARSISLSGLRLRLEGLDDETDTFVAHRFRRYLADPGPGAGDLTLVFRRDTSAAYLEPPALSAVSPAGPASSASKPGREASDDPALLYQMQHAVRGGALYYASVTTCVRIDLARGTGMVLQRPRVGVLAQRDPVHIATENLLRAALAWTVLLRGGFMLHAASVVRDGRCYLFFGNSGAGKSTIASLCGGQVISDDLTMVLPDGAGFAAIGSPFRGTYTACDDLTGRYPVVAIFRLRQDPVVSVKPISGPVAFAEFLANLPFVVGEIDHHPGAWERARDAFARLKAFELRFRKDDSFWKTIDALGL